MKSSIASTQICPDIQPCWQLRHRANSHQWVLQVEIVMSVLAIEAIA